MSTVPDSPPERWDVAAILRETVQHKHRQLAPRLDPDLLGRMIAAWGEGPDPVVGERVVGFFPLTGNDQRSTTSKALGVLNPARAVGRHLAGASWDESYGAFVTDRAVILRGSGETLRVPFDAIESLDRSGGTAVAVIGYSAVYVTLAGTQHSVDLGPRLGGPMVAFLEAIGPLATEGELVPTEPCVPSPSDPLGLAAVRRSLPAVDGRTSALLDAVAARSDRGELSEDQAIELVQRIGLHARSGLGGRGRHEGRWVSALPVEALERFFAELGHLQLAEGDEAPPPEGVLRMALDTKGERAPALLSRHVSAKTLSGTYTLDLAEQQVVGVEGSTYELIAPSTFLGVPSPHHQVNAKAEASLHQGLLRAEARWLARAVLVGPDADLATQLELADDEVLERLQADVASPLPQKMLDRARVRVQLPAPTRPTGPRFRPAPSQRRSAPRPVDDRPTALFLAGLLQIVASVITMVLSSFTTWMVLLILATFVQRILGLIRFVDEDAVGALFVLAGTFVAFGQFAVAGPIRLGLGLLLLPPFRFAPALVQGAAVLTALLSLATLDPVGLAASGALLVAWRRPEARAWSRGELAAAAAPGEIPADGR